ncbi:hypothetical protein ACWDTI_02260 [Gordonia sp. NPDC003424]
MTDEISSRRATHRAARHSLACTATAGLAAMMLATPTPAAATPAPPTVVRDCSGQPEVRPSDLDSIYCGVAGIMVTRIVWRDWGRASAHGGGIERRLVCRDRCTHRIPQVYTVEVRLSSPQDGEFTRLRLTPQRGGPEEYALIGALLR